MTRSRGRLTISACVLALVIGGLIVQRNRLRPQDPPTSTAQARLADSLRERGFQAPTKWGMHLLLDDGEIQWPTEVWDDHLAYARRLVGEGGYVLQLVRLSDLDAEKWQIYIDRAIAHGLKPMIRLASNSDPRNERWAAPPKDANGETYHAVAQEFARFVSSLSYPGVLYVTVGNEPNRGDEWGGTPKPAEYAQFLLNVSSALHASG